MAYNFHRNLDIDIEVASIILLSIFHIVFLFQFLYYFYYFSIKEKIETSSKKYLSILSWIQLQMKSKLILFFKYINHEVIVIFVFGCVMYFNSFIIYRKYCTSWNCVLFPFVV